MIAALLIGNIVLMINLAIQVLAVVITIRYFLRRLDAEAKQPSINTDFSIIAVVLSVLFAGLLLQFATWAWLFLALGEFTDFQTAFYHSVVNFTSLGYGDIVMSERWRLLGALEAANGVLMFGLTASSLLAVMSALFSRHGKIIAARKKHGLKPKATPYDRPRDESTR